MLTPLFSLEDALDQNLGLLRDELLKLGLAENTLLRELPQGIAIDRSYW